MKKWLKELDRILRGDATRMEELQKAELRIPVLGTFGRDFALAVIYAVCMGFYSMFRPDGPLFLQAFATIAQSAGAVFSDAPRHVSLALRFQCVGRLAFESHDHIAIADRSPGRESCGAGVAGNRSWHSFPSAPKATAS